MDRVKFRVFFWGGGVLCAALSILAALSLLSPSCASAQTELGSEDDLTVLGVNGTAADPDVEIKGFSVFGSTQAAYTGALAGPGNVVVNGVLAVSSGAYFVGDSTFTGAGRIFINDGSPGQLLRRNAAGYLEWSDGSALGDNLGDHTAARDLEMAGFSLVNAASATFTQGVTASSFTATGAGLAAAQLRLAAAPDIVISSEASTELGGGVRVSTNVYIVGFSSATRYYGDGSALTGLSALSDNLGDHTATEDLVMGVNSITMTGSLGATGARLTKGWFADLEVTNAITGSVSGTAATVTGAAQANITSLGILTGLTMGGDIELGANRINGTGALTVSSYTATGIGVQAAQLRLAAAPEVVISSEASTELGGGVRISTNVYIVGFSSAARYYGDGSGLTGVTASAIAAGNITAGTLGADVIASSIAADGVYTGAIQAGAVTDGKVAAGIDAAKLTGILTASSITVTGNAFGVGGSALTVNNGKVGISTDSPTGIFQVGGGTLTVLANGDVGIGTTSPEAKFHVLAYEAGKNTVHISTSSTPGNYSIAVSSEGITNINNLVIENRTSDPVTYVPGQVWLRVD